MGSVFDTFGSFIIGGIVLMMLVALVISVQQSANTAVMNEISQMSLAEMSQTLERDMNNIGYRVTAPRKIFALTQGSITFLADLDNNGAIDTVSYLLNTTSLGPEITRRLGQPGSAPLTWTSRGSMLLFAGYDSTGAVTTDLLRVRAVEASMLTGTTVESTDDVAASTQVTPGNGTISQNARLHAAVDRETGAFWHKTVYPKNLAAAAPQ